jgi:hypothetical protein
LGERHEMADDPIPFVLAGIVVSWVLTAWQRCKRAVSLHDPKRDSGCRSLIRRGANAEQLLRMSFS